MKSRYDKLKIKFEKKSRFNVKSRLIDMKLRLGCEK